MPVPAKRRQPHVPAISRPLLAFFQHIVRRYFRRHFHAVRLAGTHHLSDISGPLIIYANHGSWWDPMVAFLLADQLFPARSHFAPMDASALARYPILRKLGVFPLEMNSPRGGAQFLRTGKAVLASGGVLWITPQGEFVDPRRRPVRFKPGLAALASRAVPCTLLPLAIEYTFWDERLPEALLLFGNPIRLEAAPESPIDARLASALTRTMDQLQVLALTRSPAAFARTLTTGTVGVGGFYGLGQRLRSLLTRQPYHPEHTRPIPTPAAPASEDASRP